jgi:gamma-glutamyl:cysteine ligase YbdK (ATP-grasp superfamily)
MERDWPYALFDVVGIELEFMIVDAVTLQVRGLAAEALAAVGGGFDEDAELGPIAWCNELALHVLEMKTNGPAPSLRGLASRFADGVRQANQILAPLNAVLLPGAMHPWMDPARDLNLWPHGYNDVYKAFDRIFDCRGHGWANLQSMHINLPFRDDAEFGKLHAAIRMVLPLLPGLAASSPYADGRFTGFHDYRLEVYRHNADRIPSVVGRVVPERVFTPDEYEARILGAIYRDMEPHDPEGILRHEWANARGAIARFDRGAIEIRVIDLQECPLADLTVAALAVGAVHALTEERWCTGEAQREFSEESLGAVFDACVRDGDQARMEDAAYLRALGMSGEAVTAGAAWRHLSKVLQPPGGWGEFEAPMELLLDQGTLARRMLTRAGSEPTPAVLRELAGAMAACLQEGRLLEGR